MKTKIMTLAVLCSFSAGAFAEGNVPGTVPGSLPPVTNNPPASISSPTNYPPGQLLTNNPPASFMPRSSNAAPGYRYSMSASNNSDGFVPPGYTNPYANYTNPYYNYTNPYWAAHNTNSAGSENFPAPTNRTWNTGTNTFTGTNNLTGMPSVQTNRHHWWKWW